MKQKQRVYCGGSMFAILLHESMNPFYENISSFPTVIFTVVFAVSLLFWLVAVLGVFDIEALDIDPGENFGSAGALLMKFGLNSVPLPIIITLISFFGWIICYSAVALLNPILPGRIVELAVGVPIFIASLYVSMLITAVVIKPLRTMFKKMEATSVKHVVGQTAVVRSSRVDEKFGEAILEDGGAGLLLRVRALNGEKFKKGDRVVLLEHEEASGIYFVASEEEFNNEN